MSGGRRRAERVASRRPTGRTLLGALALLLATLAWFALVVVAIDRGRSARLGGGTKDWLLTGAATVGAALCLTLVFVLLGRAREAYRNRVRHAPGRHR